MASSVALSASAIETRDYRDDDWAGLADLFEVAYGKNAPLGRPEVWSWKHLKNPFGRSYVRVAIHQDQTLVGARVFMRWEFRINSRVVRAVRAVDTATHPGYQRMGIFSRLTGQAVDAITEAGVDTVFNTPNAMSLPGYLKLGWVSVGTIKPLVRVLRYDRIAIGLAASVIRKRDDREELGRQYELDQVPGVESIISDERLPELLEADADISRGTLRTDKTAEFVSWRYGDHPTVRYHAVSVEDGPDLLGCAIVRPNIRRGLRELVVSEIFVKTPDVDITKRLMSKLKTAAKADYMVTYFPERSFRRGLVRSCGFRQLPVQVMELVVNPRSDWARKQALDSLDQWDLSLGDLELF